MTIEEFTALRRGVDGVLLLLSRAVSEALMLRELEVDQSAAETDRRLVEAYKQTLW